MVGRESKRVLQVPHLQLVGVIEGYCPVQAEGTVFLRAFYFHSRWSEWAFSITETVGISAIDIQSMIDGESFGFLVTGSTAGLYDASWMHFDEVERIIRHCSSQYLELQSK